MRQLLIAVVASADALLLTLPGYCSDWWPVWIQVLNLTAGVVGLAVGAALLGWLLSGDVHVWKV